MSDARAVLDAAMTEDELLTLLLGAADVYGWMVFHVRDSKRGVVQGPRCKGFPDLVMGGGSPRRIMFREVKSQTGRLTQEQANWGAMLMAAGADWGVWRPSDWPAIRRELAGEPASTEGEDELPRT